MYIADLKTEFYEVISNNWILLLVGNDVDSLCACKILQYLFHCDNVLYTLISITGKKSLIKAFQLHQEQVKYVVMINCGSTIDIVEALEPDDDVIFFVCDTHRPVDVYNIYSNSQIRLLMKDSDEMIPGYEDIFRDSDESEDDEDHRISETRILKRRERRLWEDKRHKIMFDYTQFSYYGTSSAMLMFNLTWKMGRDNTDLLWWAIIGLTEQYVHKKIEHERYVLNVSTLQNHVSRHSHSANSSERDAVGNYMKINFAKELNLLLYRQWSIFDSVMYTKYTACKFKLWTFKGQRRMLEFLAEIGIPLVQCKQKFSAMDSVFRSNICNWIENMSEKYRLSHIVFGSFNSQFGYKGKFCATDVVLAISALLESTDQEKTDTDKFLLALDALGKTHISILQHGIELAKLQQVAIFNQVQSFVDMKHVMSAGPFLYAVIQEGTSDIKHFSYPGCLAMLAHFVLEAHVAVKKKALALPLVLMTLDSTNAERYLVIGIPPVSEGSPKNFFGKAFEQAAQHVRAVISNDYFDSSIISINGNDKSKFFDALISILS